MVEGRREERKQERGRTAQAAKLRRWQSHSPICQSDHLAKNRVAHTQTHTFNAKYQETAQ